MSVRFTEAFKIQAIEKALNRPTDCNLKHLADSLGVGLSTLNKWIRKAKNNELEMATDTELKAMTYEKRPKDWSLDERLNMIMECANKEPSAINQLCRSRGIYPHHIEQWKAEFINGTASPTVDNNHKESKALKVEIKSLKKELNRKDRALAETAALLVLQKKVNAIWGTNEDN